MQSGYVTVAERSVHAACIAKGLPLGTPAEGEEWALGPWCVVRHLRLVRESLAALARSGNTPIGEVGRTGDGRLAVRVFPANRIDGLLFRGVRVDVHLQAGMTEEAMHASRARFYKSPDHDGRVVLVLGAGNVNAIISMDVITKLFNEGKVCVVKMHPVNAYLGPYLEEAYAEAIAQDFLAVTYGGADEGAYLVQHPGVDEIHITGSDKTFDLLVWGPPGPERARRIAENRPLLEKPITAELGNVSPVIVVPGPYRETELQFQAEAVAGAVANNASFNCNAARMLVTPRGWRQREALLAGIGRALTRAPGRKAYYPGARDRWRAVTEGRSDMRTIGAQTADTLPWTLVPDLDPDDREERAYRSEAFCPVLFETQTAGADPLEFLDQAVAFANERLWGTLSATLVVHPKLLRDPRVNEAVERAIARLRYGAVGVNAFPGLVFAFGSPPWGAHPSSTPADIQSGCGWVHNTPMLQGIEKAVLHHPLTTTPKPPYFPGHRSAHVLVRRLTSLEETASWMKLPGVMSAALRG